jgi:hypothetical protein
MIQELVFEDASFFNFEPSLRQRFESQLESLLESAPSDANSFLSLKPVRQGYEGMMKIVSSQGRFVAEAVCGNMNDLMGTLARQINDQLREWRGLRFRSE